jgi:geranylgeranyl diphosphate synthase type I
MIDLTHYIEKTRKRIDARLLMSTPLELYEITKEGKKLRSVLCCLVYDTLTGFKSPQDGKMRVRDLACSVEVVHNVTLAADDIIDQDDMRRGKPSLHALKGFSIAFLEVLSGISFPYQMVAPYGVEYINAVSQVQQDMCYGVLKEITKDLPATRIYEIVIDKKTGVLFSLGRAYQIADDIEDFIDVVAHKKTPDAITGTEFILLRGLKVDEILKEWGLDIVKGKPDLTKVSQTKQLFQLYELLATLNRRLEIELQRTIDTIGDYDERDVLQKYLKLCIPR